jgi:hypothetical protein
MSIEVREHYNTWVNEQLLPLFEKSGVSITQNARNLLAYALQSQVEEKVIGNDQDLIARAERFCGFAVQLYQKKYGNDEMTFNRAMHFFIAITCA